MYSVSSKWASAVTNGGKLATRVDIMRSGVVISSNLAIYDGSIDANSKNTTRRSAWFACTDPTGTLTPQNANDLLTPYLNEFAPWRGFTYPDGTTELVPLGVFAIADVEIYDSSNSFALRITGYDRAKTISRSALQQPYTIAAGVSFESAILGLLTAANSTLMQNAQFSASGLTVPALVYPVGGDPWAIATDLATAAGMALYFDVQGRCTLAAIPDPLAAPITWNYIEGGTATFLYLNKHLDTTSTFNHIIVIGQHPDSTSGPVRAEAMDNNTASPTYVGGPYGHVVDVFKDLSIKTQAQAQLVADSRLRTELGLSEEVEMTNIVNAAHDVNDVIYINRAKSKLNDRYVIDGLSIPLTYSRAMTISTRKRQVPF